MDPLPECPPTPEAPVTEADAGTFPASQVREPGAPHAAGPQTHRHLDARDPSTWNKPDDVSWGDHFLVQGKPLRSRHKLLARYCALGKTNREIAELLGYSEPRVSVLLSNTKIRQEIDLYRDRLYDGDLAQAFKDLLPEALYAVEDVLKHEATSYKDKLAKTDTAKWVIEKIDGKAAQKVNVESGTLTRFLDILGQMQERGETLDVSPGGGRSPSQRVSEESLAPPGLSAEAKADLPPTEADPARIPDYAKWLDDNI
jgi:hypothetical protein